MKVINQKLYKWCEFVRFLWLPPWLYTRQTYLKYHLIMGSFSKARISRESKTRQVRVVAHRTNVQGRLKACLYHSNITYMERVEKEKSRNCLPTDVFYARSSAMEKILGVCRNLHWKKRQKLHLIIFWYTIIYIIKVMFKII